MENEMQPYIVYVKPDEQGLIIAVNSSAFLTDLTGWVEIDSGYGDKYHHAQGNFFEKPIYDERGICRYKLVDGKPVERPREEMDADEILFEQPKTEDERITALEEQIEMLLSGVTSDE